MFYKWIKNITLHRMQEYYISLHVLQIDNVTLYGMQEYYISLHVLQMDKEHYATLNARILHFAYNPQSLFNPPEFLYIISLLNMQPTHIIFYIITVFSVTQFHT